ncbi:ABC transporter permease [Candidatus Woesearchaeota archaeon]|nr:ABC transporter permease [Candidatus Woesearchaeota archaeon]
MIDVESMKYSLRNLWKRKSRSTLTILSIFIGIATIFIFISFGLGLTTYVNELASEAGVDKFIVQGRSQAAPGLDDAFSIGDKDREVVAKTKGVRDAIGYKVKIVQVEKDSDFKFVFGGGYVPSDRNNEVLFQSFGINILKGRELKKGDMGKVTMGFNYQQPLRIFDDPIELGEKITINDKKYEVIGFYEPIGNPGDDSNVYFTEEELERLFDGEDISYGAIFGTVSNPENLNKVVESVEKNLRNSRGLDEGKEDFFVQTFEEAIEQFSIVLNVVVGFIILIALISVVVSAVNTANTMVTSVLERTKEIGVMKAIGATRATIRNIFLFESAVLGFVAGVIGVLFGYMVSSSLGTVLDQIGWGFLAPEFTPFLFIGLILFATVIGTLSGVIIAIQAARLNAVDALRYE